MQFATVAKWPDVAKRAVTRPKHVLAALRRFELSARRVALSEWKRAVGLSIPVDGAVDLDAMWDPKHVETTLRAVRLKTPVVSAPADVRVELKGGSDLLELTLTASIAGKPAFTLDAQAPVSPLQLLETARFRKSHIRGHIQDLPLAFDLAPISLHAHGEFAAREEQETVVGVGDIRVEIDDGPEAPSLLARVNAVLTSTSGTRVSASLFGEREGRARATLHFDRVALDQIPDEAAWRDAFTGGVAVLDRLDLATVSRRFGGPEMDGIAHGKVFIRPGAEGVRAQIGVRGFDGSWLDRPVDASLVATSSRGTARASLNLFLDDGLIASAHASTSGSLDRWWKSPKSVRRSPLSGALIIRDLPVDLLIPWHGA